MSPAQPDANGFVPHGATQPATEADASAGGLRVKLGGVTEPEVARLAGELGVWAVGVTLQRQSRRFVSAAQAREILAALPPGVRKVGQFRNQSPEIIARVADELSLDLLELRGHETDEVVREIGPQRVIKSVVVHELIGTATVLGYSAAHLQLDKAYLGTPQPADMVDWRVAADLAQRFAQTWIGGPCEPEDLGELWRTVRPFGVDISRGVESEADPRCTDPERVRAFMTAAAAVTSTNA